MTALISRMATAAGILALASACTMKDQDAPPLAGPSEFSQSIAITVSPDVLPQDGASQSFITVTARDANSQPMRNVTVRTETRVGGTPVDFGMLSARSVVTGSDGKATLVYTAPPSPAVSPDSFIVVDIVVTPFGTDFGNSSSAQRGNSAGAAGDGYPARRPGAGLHFHTHRRRLKARRCSSTPRPARDRLRSISGTSVMATASSGRTASHAYDTAGTYVARLTIVDSFGRAASISRSLTVGDGAATRLPHSS